MKHRSFRYHRSRAPLAADVSRHMIVIRATADEVDLSASLGALAQLAQFIRELKTGREYRCPADAAADPSPYEHCLAGLHVLATDGPVRVSVDGALLVVEGYKSNLDRFTSFLALEGPGPIRTTSTMKVTCTSPKTLSR